jgi:hypothetical protein
VYTVQRELSHISEDFLRSLPQTLYSTASVLHTTQYCLRDSDRFAAICAAVHHGLRGVKSLSVGASRYAPVYSPRGTTCQTSRLCSSQRFSCSTCTTMAQPVGQVIWTAPLRRYISPLLALPSASYNTLEHRSTLAL